MSKSHASSDARGGQEGRVMAVSDQVSIDEANEAFWNELCGTYFACSLGINDSSQASLAKFDRRFFEFYPYVDKYIPFSGLGGKRVLEVGLGYGSVAQRLAESGALYTGLDIATGPIEMAKHRFALNGQPGELRKGSILEAPFPDESFDYIVSIGCYHHTGNVAQAFAETYRLLVPNGRATVMTYNAYSYLRWLRWPFSTLRYWLWENKEEKHRPRASWSERAAYDRNSQGQAAPETDYLSMKQIRRLTEDFSRVEISRENFNNYMPIRIGRRDWWLEKVAPIVGLDLYIQLWR